MSMTSGNRPVCCMYVSARVPVPTEGFSRWTFPASRPFQACVSVITAQDLPGQNDISPMHTLDEEILCSGEIHFHGQAAICRGGG